MKKEEKSIDKTSRAGVYYNLWFDSYKDFMKQIAQTEKLVYIPSDKRGYIDQELDSLRLVLSLEKMIREFYKNKVRIGIIQLDDIYFDRTKIKNFLEDLFSDYMLRVKEAGGDIRNEARRWEKCTKAVLEQVGAELRDYGDMDVNYLDELVKECGTDVRIMAFDVWGRPAAGAASSTSTSATPKKDDSFESCINPKYDRDAVAKALVEVFKKVRESYGKHGRHSSGRNSQGKGKPAGLLLEAACRLSILRERPKYEQVESLLGEIGCPSGFRKYFPQTESLAKINNLHSESDIKQVEALIREALPVEIRCNLPD